MPEFLDDLTMEHALAVRQQFRAGGEFTTRAYEAALRAELSELHELGSDFDSYVRCVAKMVDELSTREQTPNAAGFELEGEYRLGNGRRVAKAEAQYEHMQEAIVISDREITELN